MKRLTREQKRRIQRRKANAVGVAVIVGIFAAGLVAGVLAKAAMAAPATDSDPVEIDSEATAPQEAEIMEAVEIAPAIVETEPEPTSKYREDVPLSYELQDVLLEACEVNGIPVHVALGLIETESNFRPYVVSAVGCYGLTQLNPKYFPSDLSPAENIAYGISYLGELLDRHDGDLEAALTAYNVGHDNGTRTYANKVLGAAEKWL